MSGNSSDAAIGKAEQQIKHTHQCQECQTKFLAHKDGCPKCGSSARVLPLGSGGHGVDYSALRGLD